MRDVSLVLPRNQLICLTGVSGSGKSSLAFDTLYAEGQRRYVESLSSYARQFLGQMPKPDVDFIGGLSPSISISQKAAGNNPRSTVGTVTEIYDYLRVLFARVGQGHCPQCDRPITAQSRDEILHRILQLPPGTKFHVLAPLIRQQKGEYKDLFEDLLKQGFVRARVDGTIHQLNAARLYKSGWTAHSLMALGTPISVAVLVVAVALGARATAAVWAVFCVSCTVGSLSQPAIGRAFPAALAGRALSAYNLVVFAGVFCLQWGIGLAVDGLQSAGWPLQASYQGALALLAIGCTLSYV